MDGSNDRYTHETTGMMNLLAFFFHIFFFGEKVWGLAAHYGEATGLADRSE